MEILWNKCVILSLSLQALVGGEQVKREQSSVGEQKAGPVVASEHWWEVSQTSKKRGAKADCIIHGEPLVRW